MTPITPDRVLGQREIDDGHELLLEPALPGLQVIAHIDRDDNLLAREYDILEALGKMVAIELLVPGSMDSLLGEGVGGKSISVDGLAQSIQLLHSANTLKYTNVITRYAEELSAWEATYWARQGGVRFAVL